MGKFTDDDLVMNASDIVALPKEKAVRSKSGKEHKIYPQNIALLPCRFSDEGDDVLEVGSQRSYSTWYRLVHDDKEVIFCDCDFASHNSDWCPNHRERAQMVIDKRRKRLGLDRTPESKPVVQQTALEYPKEEAKREDTHRSDAPLDRQTGFNLMR